MKSGKYSLFKHASLVSLCLLITIAQAHLSIGSLKEVPVATSKEKWQSGIDYTILIPPLDSKPAPRKVEVVELFLYTSPNSHMAQPYLQKWLHGKTNVEFVRKPAICYPHARLQARMFFTLKELGRDDLHQKFFDSVFDKNLWPIYHNTRHPDEKAYFDLNLAFAKANGIDEKKFTEIYNSKEMDDRVIAAEIETHEYAVNGTSTIVVNGKYSTSIQRLIYDPKNPDKDPTPVDYERFMRLIDYLVGLETKK